MEEFVERIQKERWKKERKSYKNREGKVFVDSFDKSKREVVYRETAEKRGEKFYFTGEKCKNGHRTLRYTSNKKCRECSANYRLSYKSKWYASDKGKIETAARAMVRRVIQYTGVNKSNTTENELGYSFEYLQNQIEVMWLDGMTWENYGDWHIDHIVPVSRLVDSGITDQSIINHPLNLAPMWSEHNLKKNIKTAYEFLSVYPEMVKYYEDLLERESSFRSQVLDSDVKLDDRRGYTDIDLYLVPTSSIDVRNKKKKFQEWLARNPGCDFFSLEDYILYGGVQLKRAAKYPGYPLRYKNERKVSVSRYKKYLEFLKEDPENEKITFEMYCRYSKIKLKSVQTNTEWRN